MSPLNREMSLKLVCFGSLDTLSKIQKIEILLNFDQLSALRPQPLVTKWSAPADHHTQKSPPSCLYFLKTPLAPPGNLGICISCASPLTQPTPYNRLTLPASDPLRQYGLRSAMLFLISMAARRHWPKKTSLPALRSSAII